MRYRQPSAQWVSQHPWEVFAAPVWPDEGAKPRRCYSNVLAKVAASGGRRLDAWEVVELEETLLQFRPHVLWCRPDETIVDVTPSEFGFDHTLCLRAHRGFTLPLPPTRFVPLCDAPEVGEFCLVETLAGQLVHDCRRGQVKPQERRSLGEECRRRLWDLGQPDLDLAERLLRTVYERLADDASD